MTQTQAESVKDLAKEAAMTKEENLIQAYTKAFKSIGELQRIANELEENDEK